MTDITIPPSGICQHCYNRPATLWWATDTTSAARGYAQARCEVCTLKEQVEHAKNRASELPKLEARLAELLAKE